MAESKYQVLVRLPADVFEAITKCAEQEDRSRASTIRRAIRQYLGEPGANEQ